MACSDHFPGATSDIDVMRYMVSTLHCNQNKCANEFDIPDIDPHVERHGNSWALLDDKG